MKRIKTDWTYLRGVQPPQWVQDEIVIHNSEHNTIQFKNNKVAMLEDIIELYDDGSIEIVRKEPNLFDEAKVLQWQGQRGYHKDILQFVKGRDEEDPEVLEMINGERVIPSDYIIYNEHTYVIAPAISYENSFREFRNYVNKKFEDFQPVSVSLVAGLASEAVGLIDNRAHERDMEQERSMARTVASFNAATGHNLTEAEGWVFMQHLKASRASQGAFRKDDYLDKIAYTILEVECRLKEHHGQTDKHSSTTTVNGSVSST